MRCSRSVIAKRSVSSTCRTHIERESASGLAQRWGKCAHGAEPSLAQPRLAGIPYRTCCVSFRTLSQVRFGPGVCQTPFLVSASMIHPRSRGRCPCFQFCGREGELSARVSVACRPDRSARRDTQRARSDPRPGWACPTSASALPFVPRPRRPSAAARSVRRRGTAGIVR